MRSEVNKGSPETCAGGEGMWVESWQGTAGGTKACVLIRQWIGMSVWESGGYVWAQGRLALGSATKLSAATREFLLG